MRELNENEVILDRREYEHLLEHYQPKNSEDGIVITITKLVKLVEEVRQEFEHKYKDKVILDKEEYNKVDNIFKMSISDHIAYLRENERLKEDVQALIGMRFNRFNLITQEESDKQIQQVYKETAERDFNTIIKALKERKVKIQIVYGIAKRAGIDIAISEIESIAKQFGVEIRE